LIEPYREAEATASWVLAAEIRLTAKRYFNTLSLAVVFAFVLFEQSHRSSSLSESASIIIRAAVTWDAFARAQFSVNGLTFDTFHQFISRSVGSVMFFCMDSI
jgi:hypothetical protein